MSLKKQIGDVMFDQNSKFERDGAAASHPLTQTKMASPFRHIMSKVKLEVPTHIPSVQSPG